MWYTVRRREAFAANYFIVEIDGHYGAFFRSCSGLKSEAEVVPIQEGGLNSTEHRRIGRTKYPNLVLKQGFTGPDLWRKRSSFVENDSTKIKRFNGTVIQMGPGGKKAHMWQFVSGWICKWEGPEFDASKNEISVETIEIAHEGLVYVKGDSDDGEATRPALTTVSRRAQNREQSVGSDKGGGEAKKKNPTKPIDDPKVKAAMKKAWKDSQAGDAAKRHEEGGYIVKQADGEYGVESWPRGTGASIAPPARDKDGKYNGKEVVGEFHTHPNPPVDEKGRKWTQGGHQGDWTGIQAEKYSGPSYIIAKDDIYEVDPKGSETKLGKHEKLLGK